MDYKTFYIFVEGDDDKRFFEKIVTPLFEGKYKPVKVWRYAQQKKEKINKSLKSIKEMSADYIYESGIKSMFYFSKTSYVFNYQNFKKML